MNSAGMSSSKVGFQNMNIGTLLSWDSGLTL